MSEQSADAVAALRTVPESTAARLSLIVGRLNRKLALAPGGLSHGLLMSLATVAKRGPLRLAELAAAEQVSAPSVTRTVAELEARGLVQRSVDPDDGRAFRVEATPAGLDAILRARAARAEVLANLLSGLDASEIATVEAALPALERALNLD
ncbi:MAG TPA: MarR family transcriptional regulator [Galbitalea sp.]|jgi:DNA-binding MarR family transcriptional regulator|nr:MarR family transcriptional regulator [Galbitalea sp.]